MLFILSQDWEPANFLAAPASGIFSIFSSCSGSGSKEPKTPGSGSLALFFPDPQKLVPPKIKKKNLCFLDSSEDLRLKTKFRGWFFNLGGGEGPP